VFGSPKLNPSRRTLGTRQNYMGHGHGFPRTRPLNETTCTRTYDIQATRWFTCIRNPRGHSSMHAGNPVPPFLGPVPGPRNIPGPFVFVFHDGLKPIVPRPGGSHGRVCGTGGPYQPVRIPKWGSAMAPFFRVNRPAETKPFPWRAVCKPPCGPISLTHTSLSDNRGAEKSTACGSIGRLDYPT